VQIRLGSTASGEDTYVPLTSLVPFVHPNDLVIGGWDINNLNLADAMARARVLDWGLQQKLRPYMTDIVPLPSIYIPDFIAANQKDRANNVLEVRIRFAGNAPFLIPHHSRRAPSRSSSSVCARTSASSRRRTSSTRS
jgi:hypothetical protein